MSGGVDSSVAALLLAKNAKYEVIGCFIKGYNIDGCQEADAEDARRVAEKLKIPFYVWDFEDEYKKKVVDYMVDGYRRGITPNPDVMCNKEIKFGLFLKKALEMGADFVATGHYVRRRPEFPIINYQFSNTPESIENSLKIAKDFNKDQSYFLWTLTQEQLKHCLFPIGDYLKSEVREIARKADLPTAGKKDSQGICFLGAVKFKDFLKQYLPVKKGDILNIEGEKIGEHDGVWFYTIGQRRIDVVGRKTQIANQKPHYVVKKDIKKNTLVIAEGNDAPMLYKKEIELTSVNFINRAIYNFKSVIPVFARIRYRQPLVKAELKKIGNGWKLIFSKPVKFVAPGQSAVFYEYKKHPSASSGLKMLGGGVILN